MTATLQDLIPFNSLEREARLRFLFQRYGDHLEPCRRELARGAASCTCLFLEALAEVRMRPPQIGPMT